MPRPTSRLSKVVMKGPLEPFSWEHEAPDEVVNKVGDAVARRRSDLGWS